MKKSLIVSVLSSVMLLSGVAAADNTSLAVGANIDISAPSGAAVGLDLQLPYVHWAKVGVSATYLFAPGVRGNILLDPIKFPVAPVLNFDLGYQSSFKLPSTDKSPDISWTYEDIQGGLAFGSREGFRFLLLGGITHLDGSASNFQNTVKTSNGITVGSPTFQVWVPSARLGIVWIF